MQQKKHFNPGDKVALLNEAVSGIIIKIQGKQVIILTEDDFEYECKLQEIVPNSNLADLLEEAGNKKIKSDKEITKAKKKTKANSFGKSSLLEVDLHIHELVSSEKGMSNFEMLEIQLHTAKNKLESAIKNKNQRIIFIHGIGEGILKKELHKLFKNYPVEYYEASYQKYGRGATEVYIFQNKKNSK